MGVRVFRPLCRNPHILLDADAELDLDLILAIDLDPLHQPGYRWMKEKLSMPTEESITEISDNQYNHYPR